MRKMGETKTADARILGGSEFVTKVIREADTRTEHQLCAKKDNVKLESEIKKICEKAAVSEKEMKSGSRRKEVSQTRNRLVVVLVKEYGITFAECARRLGVTTSAIAKILVRQ